MPQHRLRLKMFLEELDEFVSEVIGRSRPIQTRVFLYEGTVVFTELFGGQSGLLLAELHPRVSSYGLDVCRSRSWVYICTTSDCV